MKLPVEEVGLTPAERTFSSLGFTAHWSREDDAWIGLVAGGQFPSLSWIEEVSGAAALTGIKRITAEALADLQ